MDALKVLLAIIGFFILLPIAFYVVVLVGASGAGGIFLFILLLMAMFSKK